MWVLLLLFFLGGAGGGGGEGFRVLPRAVVEHFGFYVVFALFGLLSACFGGRGLGACSPNRLQGCSCLKLLIF